MKPSDWDNLIDIDWETCFASWKETSQQLEGDVESLTGEYLNDSIIYLIAVGLDDHLTVADFSRALGVALAQVSLDALVETIFYVLQIIEAHLVRVGGPEVVTVSELAQATNTPVDPTLLNALRTRHTPAYAQMLGGFYQSFPEGITLMTTMLLLHVWQLVAHTEAEAISRGQPLEQLIEASSKAIDAIVEEAIINYLGSNRHLAMTLLDPEDQARMGNDNPGFFVLAMLDGTEVRIRLSMMSSLG